MNKYPQTAMALGVAALVFTGVTAAGNSIEDTHSFRLGYLSQDAEISAQSTIDPLPPIEIDLTDDLGMDDNSDSLQLHYSWRFAERWSLGVTYQKLELEGNGEAAFDFNFDGNDYTAGAAVETEFNMDTYLIDVGYAIVRNDKWQLEVGAGIHAFDIEAAIAGTVAIEGEGIEDGTFQTARAGADVLAPLPNLRAGVTFLITPRWEVRAGAGWLSLEIDDIDGNYTYLNVGTEYRVTDHFGIGAAYSLSKMDVTSTDGDGLDSFDVEFSGPSVFLTYGF